MTIARLSWIGKYKSLHFSLTEIKNGMPRSSAPEADGLIAVQDKSMTVELITLIFIRKHNNQKGELLGKNF